MSKTIQNPRHPAFIIVLFLPGLLLLALPYYRPADIPVIFLFIGRLHPLILHFPIVLIILALLFEAARYFDLLKSGDSVVMVILIAAAISTLASIGAGFFLFASGDYAGYLMEQHFWAGVITGVCVFTTLALYATYRIMARAYPFYVIALALSTISVGYASHLGGSITHGQDYLSEHLNLIMDDSDDVDKPESEMLVYEDIIAPVFEAKCLSCHNEQKSKGKLIMTSYQNILRMGESGLPSVTPGVPEKSELFNRIVLPAGHDDHMPPEGKTPMNAEETKLLKFWIESGATDTLSLRTAAGNEDIRQTIRSLLPELTKYKTKAKVARLKTAALQQELNEVARELNISIYRDSAAEGNFFILAMKFPPAPFTNDQFRTLSPFFEVFSRVSLTASDIDDPGLYYIGQMVNVKELYLQKTKLDGSGLVYLQNLPNLEVLNLSFTRVDDKGAIDLLKIPNLKEVYLYRTYTSREVLEAIEKNKPGLKVLMEEGPYF
ncbi:MAG: cytochrome C [Marivirga sp.]|nr:cytochrome C [Marivirga sp.]